MNCAINRTNNPQTFFPVNFQEIAQGISFGVLGGGILAVSDSFCERKFIPKQGVIQDQTAVRVMNLFKLLPKGSFFSFIFFTGVTPVAEEFFYRGLIRQKQIEFSNHKKEPFSQIMTRIFVNSGIFTLAHVELGKKFKASLYRCLPIFMSGLVFNSIVEKTENLWGATLAHSIINAITFHKMKK